jgi:hypothetical protein
VCVLYCVSFSSINAMLHSSPTYSRKKCIFISHKKTESMHKSPKTKEVEKRSGKQKLFTADVTWAWTCLSDSDLQQILIEFKGYQLEFMKSIQV